MSRGFGSKRMQVVSNHKGRPKGPGRGKKEAALNSPVELTADEERAFKKYMAYYQEKKIWKSTMTTPLRILVRLEFLSATSISQIKEAEDMIQTFENGTRNISPELSAFIKLHSQFRELSDQFGMTPKAAQQVRGLVDEKQLDLFQNTPFSQAK